MKSFVLLMLMVGAAFYANSQSLSLKERQAVAALDFSWSEKRILDNYGSAVKVELDQPSVAGDMDAINYADSRGAQYIANAFARICDDKLGKEALQGKKITKAVIKNIREGKPKVEIKSGVLTLFTGLSSDHHYTEAEVKDAIENLL